MTVPSTAAPTSPDAEAPVLLVANRGEIAVRVLRTARDLGLRTVAIHPADDADSLHVRLADEVVELTGVGSSAYLDIPQVIEAARRTGAGLVHPGYGFLAESPAFARACAEAGLTFLGPGPDALDLTGSKTATKARAQELGIPVTEATAVLAGSGTGGETGEGAGRVDVSPAADLLARHPGGIAIKAVAGGGGRGIALVTDPEALASTVERCRTEAERGFGDGRVFAETWMTGARHVEVQCLGTETGVQVLGDRDCSLQRRRQKVVELAPAPDLREDVRAALHDAAVRLLESMDYRSLATVEFLVVGGGADAEDDPEATTTDWVLLEVNPRIQVEHTVTEAVTGLDLVAAQIAVGRGEDLSTDTVVLTPDARGTAIELRVCAETAAEDGTPLPATGTVTDWNLPSGPGVRVDTWVRSGTTIGALYDTVIAKIIVHGPDLATARRRARAALDEFTCTGVDTNVATLAAILDLAPLGAADTAWLDTHGEDVRALAARIATDRSAEAPSGSAIPGGGGPGGQVSSQGQGASRAGTATVSAESVDLADGEEIVRAPLSGTIIAVEGGPGELGLIEAMKMHHPIPAPAHSEARALVSLGQTVTAGQPVFVVRTAEEGASDASTAENAPHPGVDEVVDRHAAVLDEARPEPVAKIHGRGRRTARENLDDLIVPGTFVEYGPLVIAAQQARRSLDDLIARTSGDGLVGGIAQVDTPAGPCEAIVMSYDYMVLAGTQGSRNHAKTDRLIQVAAQRGIPVVLFAEGGGGRPGDTDRAPGAHLKVHTFAALAGLKGKVPLVAIVSGRCFAGNAALAGVCDVIIATPDANLGMGGPAMIEGGGLGRYRPEDIGPVGVHTVDGVIDVLVEDDAAAVVATQQYLGYFTGAAGNGSVGVDENSIVTTDAAEAPSPELPRAVVPGDRLRAFQMRDVIRSVVDVDSFLELRPEYAPGAITGLARVDGRPVAVIANDNHHLGGAIDVDAARSFVETLEIAQAHGLPVVSFVDTPGFMVGPESEHEPGVKAFGRLFTTGAGLTVPVGAVIVRKGYGLGAMAMTAGSFAATQFTIAWPSGEMGPMGLEGAVRLGYSKELAALENDPAEQQALYDRLVAESYEQGRAMTAAMLFDVDDVIDPADTRRWIRSLF
ncbi:acetyl-CoA carboxylase family protein [Brevibacterium litoralis]|uniref:acetyl-CoA carboxylase family protein n=1 Tax=Brevibacterium litoralis TaxID=3138935 RepID=UPI0032ECDDB1